MPDSYQAQAIVSGAKARTTSGRLSLSGGSLQFESPETRVTLRMEHVEIVLGGLDGMMVFFRDPAQPDLSLYTSDAQILSDPIWDGYPQHRRCIAALRRQRKAVPPLYIVAAVCAVLFLGGLLLLVLEKDRLVKAIADRIPIEWEQKLGEQLFEKVKREENLVNDARMIAELESLTAPLVAAAASGAHRFQFHISVNTNINAFAMPGGHVIVFTGLLAAADTPEEVAGVLAHEMAHVTHRHGFRSIIESAGLFLLVRALVGDSQGVLGVLSEGSQTLLRQKFSRDFERDADETGWRYLLAARINPRGMIEFFKKLQGVEASQGADRPGASLQLLSTHPATRERIERLETMWQAVPVKSGFIEFPDRFKDLKARSRPR
jgi:Zn-dependent protease with chaperone function